jgi:Signal transduction histidine kinase regulating C4-dicarboxylate transport system
MADKQFSTPFEELIATRSLVRLYPWILTGLVILYLITFPIFKSPILVSIPVVVAGWFYYRRGGIVASTLAVVLNLFLLNRFVGQSNWNTLFTLKDGFLIGHVFVAIISIIIGYLRGVFEHLFQLNQRLRSQERFLTLSNMIIKKILVPSKPDRLFDDIVHHLTNLFVADYGYIARWDHIREKAFLIATTDSIEGSSLNIELNPNETRITKNVLQTGEIVLIEDTENMPHNVSPLSFPHTSHQARSAICFPLVAREYKFGTAILAYESPRHYSIEDRTYAEQVGYQIALALWTVRQDEISKQQLNETRTLMQIGQALGQTERIGLDVVLQLIVDSARKLIPQAEKTVIHLVDKDDRSLVPWATSGFPQNEKTIPRLAMHIENSAAGQVLRQGITINIADVNTDSRFLQMDIKPAYRSLLVAPVQTAGKQLGTISVESGEPSAFSEPEAELLAALGNQAAIAIENTRLFETTSHSLEELSALYHINQRLAASLDADVLMKEVVELLQQSFHYYHVQIYLIDSEQRDSVLRQASSDVGTRLKNMKHHLLAGEGIVGHVAYTSKPFVTNDVDKVVFFVRNPLLPDTKSELATPIIIDHEVLGVLDIQQIPPYRLTEQDLQIASAVAEQLAVALQKANLYTNLQTALEHEQTMRSQLVQSERLSLMGKLLASVSHELNNPLQTIQNALFLIRDELQQSGNQPPELDIISEEMDRMVMLLERLRSTYRPLHADEFKAVQINDIIEDVHKLVSAHLHNQNISFEFHPDPGIPPVRGLANHLKQVILNLFINAVEAMPEGGHLCVDTFNLPVDNEVLFSIMDNGTGIEPDLLSKIFDPFVTNKETGTGLGLTITHEIVEQHRGRILVENVSTAGAKFSVWLPVWSEADA